MTARVVTVGTCRRGENRGWEVHGWALVDSAGAPVDLDVGPRLTWGETEVADGLTIADLARLDAQHRALVAVRDASWYRYPHTDRDRGYRVRFHAVLVDHLGEYWAACRSQVPLAEFTLTEASTMREARMCQRPACVDRRAERATP